MKTSRRIFIAGAGALGATALSRSAWAQNAIDEIISSTNRGNWDAQFDARAATTTGGDVLSTTPIFSLETIAHVEQMLKRVRG